MPTRRFWGWGHEKHGPDPLHLQAVEAGLSHLLGVPPFEKRPRPVLKGVVASATLRGGRGLGYTAWMGQAGFCRTVSSCSACLAALLAVACGDPSRSDADRRWVARLGAGTPRGGDELSPMVADGVVIVGVSADGTQEERLLKDEPLVGALEVFSVD